MPAFVVSGDGSFMASERISSSTPFGAGDDVVSGAFVATTSDRNDWRAAPIDPDWILEGRPVARFVPLARGRDDLGSTSLWDCTAGRFRWWFRWDETVHVLDGAVTVTLPDGTVHRLTAGSVAFFPAGSTAVWQVEGYVRKLAVCRRAWPGPLSRAVALARRARDTIRALRATVGTLPGQVAGAAATFRSRVVAATALGMWVWLDFVLDVI